MKRRGYPTGDRVQIDTLSVRNSLSSSLLFSSFPLRASNYGMTQIYVVTMHPVFNTSRPPGSGRPPGILTLALAIAVTGEVLEAPTLTVNGDEGRQQRHSCYRDSQSSCEDMGTNNPCYHFLRRIHLWLPHDQCFPVSLPPAPSFPTTCLGKAALWNRNSPQQGCFQYSPQ